MCFSPISGGIRPGAFERSWKRGGEKSRPLSVLFPRPTSFFALSTPFLLFLHALYLRTDRLGRWGKKEGKALPACVWVSISVRSLSRFTLSPEGRGEGKTVRRAKSGNGGRKVAKFFPSDFLFCTSLQKASETDVWELFPFLGAWTAKIVSCSVTG